MAFRAHEQDDTSRYRCSRFVMEARMRANAPRPDSRATLVNGEDSTAWTREQTFEINAFQTSKGSIQLHPSGFDNPLTRGA